MQGFGHGLPLYISGSLMYNTESEDQNMSTDRPRYTVSVDHELFQQIEDFRFSRRFQTRSEATVELIRLGLSALEQEQSGREKPAEKK